MGRPRLTLVLMAVTLSAWLPGSALAQRVDVAVRVGALEGSALIGTPVVLYPEVEATAAFASDEHIEFRFAVYGGAWHEALRVPGWSFTPFVCAAPPCLEYRGRRGVILGGRLLTRGRSGRMRPALEIGLAEHLIAQQPYDGTGRRAGPARHALRPAAEAGLRIGARLSTGFWLEAEGRGYYHFHESGSLSRAFLLGLRYAP